MTKVEEQQIHWNEFVQMMKRAKREHERICLSQTLNDISRDKYPPVYPTHHR